MHFSYHVTKIASQQVAVGHALKPNKKCKVFVPWLQEQAWKFLEYCQALTPVYHTMKSAEIARIETDDIVKLIKNQIREHLRYHNVDPLVVLVGYDVWKVISSCHEPHTVSFNTSTQFYNEYGGPYFLGLEIHIVPWLEGILVAPEKIVLRQRK